MKKQSKDKFWFTLFAILLFIDLIIPDPVPLIDEIVLGILTGKYGSNLFRKK